MTILSIHTVGYNRYDQRADHSDTYPFAWHCQLLFITPIILLRDYIVVLIMAISTTLVPPPESECYIQFVLYIITCYVTEELIDLRFNVLSLYISYL